MVTYVLIEKLRGANTEYLNSIDELLNKMNQDLPYGFVFRLVLTDVRKPEIKLFYEIKTIAKLRILLTVENSKTPEDISKPPKKDSIIPEDVLNTSEKILNGLKLQEGFEYTSVFEAVTMWSLTSNKLKGDSFSIDALNKAVLLANSLTNSLQILKERLNGISVTHRIIIKPKGLDLVFYRDDDLVGRSSFSFDSFFVNKPKLNIVAPSKKARVKLTSAINQVEALLNSTLIQPN